MSVNVCTIGFSKKSLQQFVELLKGSGVTHLIDTRLNNTSQLSGYAKKNDLGYIMNLVGIKYSHDLSLAPTGDILSDYKDKRMTWKEYEKRYIDLLIEREIESRIEDILADDVVCFMCSEDKPHFCHRRLLVEYLSRYRKGIKVIHLI